MTNACTESTLFLLKLLSVSSGFSRCYSKFCCVIHERVYRLRRSRTFYEHSGFLGCPQHRAKILYMLRPFVYLLYCKYIKYLVQRAFPISYIQSSYFTTYSKSMLQKIVGVFSARKWTPPEIVWSDVWYLLFPLSSIS